MVSTKIFGAADVSVRADYAVGKSAKASDNFTKTLDNSMKASDGKYTKDNLLNDKKIKADGSQETISDKAESLKKMFDKKEIAGKDGMDEAGMKEAMETVAQFNAQLVKELAGQFNVSEEEVTEVIGNLGFDEFDMLQTGNIIDVIKTLSGNNDMAQLLVDEDVSALVKNLKLDADAITKMLENSHMTKEAMIDMKQAVEMAQEEPVTETSHGDMDVTEETAGLLKEQQVPTQEDNLSRMSESSHDSRDGKAAGDRSGEQAVDMSVAGMSNLNNEMLSNIGEFIDEKADVGGSGLSQRIFSQILDGISANVGPDTTSIELQLNPESLGKVSITVSAKEGILTAQIAAQNQVAKEAIESQISALKESFEEQGLKVEEVEITLASRQFDQNLDKEGNQENHNRSRRGRRLSAAELEELTGVKQSEPQEDVAVQMHKEQGNTVSYTA